VGRPLRARRVLGPGHVAGGRNVRGVPGRPGLSRRAAAGGRIPRRARAAPRHGRADPGCNHASAPQYLVLYDAAPRWCPTRTDGRYALCNELRSAARTHLSKLAAATRATSRTATSPELTHDTPPPARPVDHDRPRGLRRPA